MTWKKEDAPIGFYVYKLIDPRTNLPYYVGKGKGKRAFFHLKEAISTSKTSEKLIRIRDILSEGYQYVVEVVEDGLDETTACEREIDLIRHFGRLNYDDHGILTNILISTKQADFSKVIYRRGKDHHCFGVKRSAYSTSKQTETCRQKAEATGIFKCICGCGHDISGWRKNQSRTVRDKYGYADHHFDGARNNYERSAIMKQLRGKIK